MLRQCVSCKKKIERNFLIRILKEHKTHELILNPNQYQHGRSVYLCKNKDCVEAISKNKKFKTSDIEGLVLKIQKELL